MPLSRPGRTEVLGIPFFAGTLDEAIEETLAGGLVVGPAAPTLAADFIGRHVYREAVRSADLVLPDSGAMVLCWNVRHGFAPARRLRRLSGLRFLHAMISDSRVWERGTFWVMPSAADRDANLAWLRNQAFPMLSEEDTYVAPNYGSGVPPEDPELLERLERRRPEMVFLNIGGGTQEPLGAWLKRSLSYRPAIICTGAAIAFLSGQQAAIPGWADAVYLGWLLRILRSPGQYLPRYLRAVQIVPLVFRYGAALPPGRG
jgi:N-acetylglucosaminyldiphosphoundecaprenol N-acetyl-beta-D-mannosaminyltransferase